MGFGRVNGAWTLCAVRQVHERYLSNEKDVFWPFMNLEKAYDMTDQHGMLLIQNVWS